MSLTIKGQSVTEISNLFIAKMNKLGQAIQPLNHEFFEVHDCIHYFTFNGVSWEDEVTIMYIQKYFADETFVISGKARAGINSLRQQGVYEELKAAFLKSQSDFQARLAAI
jgi:hypothetical protein